MTAGEQPPPRPRDARVGRRIALAVYAVAVSYVVVAAFVSIPPQIFGRPGPATPSPVEDCTAALRALHLELVRVEQDTIAQSLARPPSREVFADWDLRHAGLERACPRDAEALAALRRVRYRVEGGLARRERDVSAAQRRLHRELGARDDAPAARGPTENPPRSF